MIAAWQHCDNHPIVTLRWGWQSWAAAAVRDIFHTYDCCQGHTGASAATDPGHCQAGLTQDGTQPRASGAIELKATGEQQ